MDEMQTQQTTAEAPSTPNETPKKSSDKKTKIIVIAAVAALLVILVTSLILFFALRDSYLEDLDYDVVDGPIYNDQMIAAKDGLWYLVKDGKPSEKGYSYLKNLNDFYPDTPADQKASRQLLDYYLAKDAEGGSYILIDKEGNEFIIKGENFSLDSVALPYLIFKNNTDGHQGVISLSALSSELSSSEAGSVSMTKTFLSVSAEKYDSESALYDYLVVTTEDYVQRSHIYSSVGKKILTGNSLTSYSFEKEDEEEIVTYFYDQTAKALYSADGVQLTNGASAPIISTDGTWGYQISKPLNVSASDTTEERFLLMFSADATVQVSNANYNFETIKTPYNCLTIDKIHTDATTIISPKSSYTYTYDTVVVKLGMLVATDKDTSETIYLSTDGRKLYSSAKYSDFVVSGLSTDTCTVLTSLQYNATQTEKHSYFFTAPNQEAVRLDLSIHDTVINTGASYVGIDEVPVYLISETQSDGTATRRIYTPFSPNQRSNSYHQIDFYSHGGITWALGTSFTGEVYDLIDPLSNHVAKSIPATSGDLARLDFTYMNAKGMLTDNSDPDSIVPVVMLRMTRHEDRQSEDASARYFALYRTSLMDAQYFQTASLQITEIGQDLVIDDPISFYGAQNCLVTHSVSGDKVYRLDKDLKLVEHASVSYRIEDLITDDLDSNKFYYVVSPLTDGKNAPLSTRYYGITDDQGKVILNPCYEDISTVIGNRFVVTLRNAEGVVEVDEENKVQTLIDFRYQSVYALPDGGFWAVDLDGETILFANGKILEDELLCAVDRIEVIHTDEDGFQTYGYAYIFNIDGELKIHMPETLNAPVCTTVPSISSISDTIDTPHAKLVYYHDASGAPTSSRLLIPTVNAAKAFKDQFTGEWYYSRQASYQLTPATAENILNDSNQFVHLYPKAD